MDQLTLTLSALADPTRRAILQRLTRSSASVGDLAKPFEISQQAVSRHLALLERAKLVEKRRDGRLQICTLTPAPLKEVADWTEAYRALWEANFRRLDALLDELKAARPAHPRRRRTRRNTR